MEYTKSTIVSEKSVPSLSTTTCEETAPSDEPPPAPDFLRIESQQPLARPDHVFGRSKKLQMVFIVSAAAVFSPLSSNIYFPALEAVSDVSPCAVSILLKICFLDLNLYKFGRSRR